MCIGFWSLTDDTYALILCTNRDEYLSRPTLPAHFHSFEPIGTESAGGPVLSGRDIQAGGTWFGINKTNGRVALLTNITEPYAVYNTSRGALPSGFLSSPSPDSLQQHVLSLVTPPSERYAGFNLLLLSPAAPKSPELPSLAFEGAYISNSGGGGQITGRMIDKDRRCGSISNGIEGSQEGPWEKTVQGGEMLEEILIKRQSLRDEHEGELVEELFELLSSQNPARVQTRAQLRTTIHVAPIDIINLQGETSHYATRLSTVLLVRRDGQALFVERDVWRVDESGEVVKGGEERRIEFTIGQY
ncbi:hypothetical protein BOTBODRAFT_32097 [Botryobasidium botryosum FD-172 SS1]|uniref:DUF833-domain-containing protein n=1 Tax=Botryobasidium botryosum (strain FD-172 SS1) TaxID=930990 RepID=A0A067MTB7_BOTB1|nr:hypothetical protein BOTBODRAFT_32097 [Botryobasidium botryosum FD-172 SS1]